jgi:3-dehydroquinate dehydratase/shikimate dehydrogenase
VGGFEVRADLFASHAAALEAVRELSKRLPVLFTLRLEGQGGRYTGADRDRAGVFKDALRCGAAAVDVEWGSSTAKGLLADRVPVVLSHHDEKGMPSVRELAEWSDAMAAMQPLAVKIVPTARRLDDSARILEWVRGRTHDGPGRIGFAMGEKGLPSRVLSLAHGAPWTYGSLGGAVAPGQPTVSDLDGLYRVATLTSSASLYGVIGNPVGHSLSPRLHNPALAAGGLDAVYLPLRLDGIEEIEPCWRPLRLRGVSVTIPFKEDALRRADEADERSRSCGATNTLIVDDSFTHREDRVRLRAFNTDFDGVLVPLRRCVPDLRGLSIAVLGNGGAARAAVQALKEAGASPAIYYRSAEHGKPVAEALRVPSARLSELRPGSHRVLINATSLGLKPGDPSPVSAEVFSPESVAFDMAYGPESTRFLVDACARGAVCIGGLEMLSEQGRVQFRHFTGQEPDAEVWERAFDEQSSASSSSFTRS